MTIKTAKKVNLSASLEDYLEAIFNLARKTDVARSRDIAEKLDVSKSSVTGALRLLKKKALLQEWGAEAPHWFVCLLT